MPDSELCLVSVCRVTVATEVRYAVPAAPGPDDPEPLDAPAAAPCGSGRPYGPKKECRS